MKATLNILILVLFIINYTISNAQTEQGSKLVGGSGNLRFQDPFYLQVAPNFGFFIVDNFAIGSKASISYSEDGGTSYTSFGILPFARFYFGKKTTRLFATGTVGYMQTWSRSIETTSSHGRARGELGLGLAHFITNQVGMEAILSYSGSLHLGIGFQIFLPSSKSK